jgi:hypothetical protein
MEFTLTTILVCNSVRFATLPLDDRCRKRKMSKAPHLGQQVMQSVFRFLKERALIVIALRLEKFTRTEFSGNFQPFFSSSKFPTEWPQANRGPVESRTAERQGQKSVLKNGKWRNGIQQKGWSRATSTARTQQSHHSHQLTGMYGCAEVHWAPPSCHVVALPSRARVKV